VEAPLDLYERIHSDLDRIQQSGLPPYVIGSFPFWTSWIPGELSLEFDPDGWELVEHHECSLWDSLNALYQPVIGRPIEWPDDRREVTLFFPGRLHIEKLAALYARVPGVTTAGYRGRLRFPGHVYRSLYPGRIEPERFTYTFHRGTGLRPAENPPADTFWCFYTTILQVEFAGRYVLESDPAPEWWSDFCPSVAHHLPADEDWCRHDAQRGEIIISDRPPATVRQDPFDVDTVVLREDHLAVHLRYSGGCQVHAFASYMIPARFTGAHPRVANLYLRHDANQDCCEAYIRYKVLIDLESITEQYYRRYHRYDPITLRVWDYEQTEFIDVLYNPGGETP
jgi:hypothetical protein